MSIRRQSPGRDPFRTLAIVSIILGMVIVCVAVVMYYATSAHAQSPLIFGTGLTLAIGGGLPNMLNKVFGSPFEPPPPPPPPPVLPEPEPQTPGSES